MIKESGPVERAIPTGPSIRQEGIGPVTNNIKVATVLNSGVINMIAILVDGTPLGGRPPGPAGGVAEKRLRAG